jgi:small ligand-binding sensory domain FIST
MPYASAISTRPDALDAVAEACGRVPPGPWNLAVVFFTPHHADRAHSLNEELHRRLSPGTALGCVAQGVLCDGREVEDGPALSLWLARWPHALRQVSFHVTLERTADGPSLFGMPDELTAPGPNEDAPGAPAVLMVGDPFTFPADFFLRRLNDDVPCVPVLGGMASGIRGPGQARLICGQQVYRDGAAGVLLKGNHGLRWVVSQGCRPIGRHMVVTKAEENVILELGGRRPLEVLRELFASLSERDKALFQKGLHVGRVIDEYKGEFQQGDFLIRNVVGLIHDTGALAVGDHVRVGQTIQFQVRDAESADEDLRALLRRETTAHPDRPGAALVFTCNGRGKALFPGPDHDASAVRKEVGDVPLAGFFAAGELGPVGRQNFIHGYTASVALFEEG